MYKIKNFFRGVQNIIDWFPVIWRDRDFDYGFTFDVLKFKLERQAKYFESCDSEKYVEIRKCIELIDKVVEEEMLFEYEKFDNIQEYFDKYHHTHKKVLNLAKGKDWTEENILFEMGRINHEKTRKKLFNTLNYNIESWWN